MSRALKVSKSIEVVQTTWPCLIVGLPSVVDASVVSELRLLFEQVFARQQRFAMIADTSAVRGLPSATTRQLLTTWLNEPAFHANIVHFNVGTATVLSSAMMRGALMALHWFWRPASPQFHAATRLDALDWCIAKLEREGHSLPGALPAYRAALSLGTTSA